MKAIGIIAEFNPMHNGHIYLINEAKKRSKCDVVIVVLSGNISNRGEFAPLDKFTKAEIALKYGVDLVVELPFFYTVQNADIFASKSVEILDHLHIDELYFGSETGDLSLLNSMAKVTSSREYNDALRRSLDIGNSYKKASVDAFACCGFSDISSNDILGLSYVKAINENSYKMKACCIQRINSDYNEINPKDAYYTSARALRNIESIDAYVPMEISSFQKEHSFMSWKSFEDLLVYKIKSMDSNALKNIFGINEGLDNAICKLKANNFEEIVDQLASRRFTKTRIQRLLCYILFDVTNAYKIEAISYIRVLRMNGIGQSYLSNIKKLLTVPLITKLKAPLPKLLELELRVSKIYSMKYHFDLYESELRYEKKVVS